jgi:hypothetical protein
VTARGCDQGVQLHAPDLSLSSDHNSMSLITPRTQSQKFEYSSQISTVTLAPKL